MKFKFRYLEKDFEMEVEKCETVFRQGRGLMFRKKSKPLLFVFKTSKKRAIHSFFCKKFFAIWFDGKKFVDGKIVSPWKFLVKPKKSFNILLEIPDCCKEFFDFTDGHRKV